VLVRTAWEVAKPVQAARDVDEPTTGARVMGQRRPGDAGVGRRARGQVAGFALGEGVQPTSDMLVTALFEFIEYLGDSISRGNLGSSSSLTYDRHGRGAGSAAGCLKVRSWASLCLDSHPDTLGSPAANRRGGSEPKVPPA
jgi:hypothetical protein